MNGPADESSSPGIDDMRAPAAATSAPLLPAAVGLCLGIGLDDLWAVPTALAGGALAAALLWTSLRRAGGWSGFAAILIGAACLGAGLHNRAYHRLDALDIARRAAQTPRLARVRGVVVSAPTLSRPSDSVFAPWQRSEPRLRLLLECQSVALEDGGGFAPVVGRIQASIKQPVFTIESGDSVEAFGWLYRTPGPTNPDQFDWRRWAKRKGWSVGLSCPHGYAVSLRMGESTGSVRGWISLVQSRARAAIQYQVQDDGRGSPTLLDTLLLDQSVTVDRAIYDAFVRTGAVHLLAVSGGNVALLAGMIWLACCAVRLPSRVTAVLMIGCVIVYWVLTDFHPPVYRACVYSVVYCTGIVATKRWHYTNWLALSALIILITRPCDLFEAEFLLSFSAVLGITYLNPVLLGLRAAFGLGRGDEMKAVETETTGPFLNRWKWLRNWGKYGLVTSLSAWLAATPIGLSLFQEFSLFGPISTLILLPFVGVLTGLAIVKVGLWYIIPQSALLLGPVLSIGAGVISRLTSLMSYTPGIWWHCAAPPKWLLALYYGVLAAIALMHRYRVRARWYMAGAGVLSLGFGLWSLTAAASRDHLKLTFLDVGHGCATVIELPNGKTLLYDAGTQSPYNVGDGVVAPALRRAGAAGVDTAMISHPNMDHFSAIPAVDDEIGIDRVAISPQFEAFCTGEHPGRLLLEEFRARRIPVQHVYRGQRLPGTGEVEIEILWPPPGEAWRTGASNDCSLVVRLRYRSTAILLCGDIEDEPLAELSQTADLRADAVLLPHHGSVRPNTANFLAKTGARVLIRSAGQHDDRTTNGLLDLVAGASYFNTAEWGAIAVTVNDRGLQVAPFRLGSP